jgi:hypothetical protein
MAPATCSTTSLVAISGWIGKLSRVAASASVAGKGPEA